MYTEGTYNKLSIKLQFSVDQN
uniref:Uncharacterized protein n=1 Tax=Anguilla anguilla TaxID=7936 RepID=A0A0E9VTU8_ANGAN